MTDSPMIMAFNAISESYLENDRALLKLCTTLIDQVQDMQHEIQKLQLQVRLLISEMKEVKEIPYSGEVQ